MTEKINHPSHYNKGGPIGKDGSAQFEAIKIIEDLGWGFAFCMGNALKYVLRALHKGAETEDLAKARWYLQRAMGCPEGLTRPAIRRTLDITDVNRAWDLTYEKAGLGVVVQAISDGDPVRALTFISRHEAKP